MLSARNIREEKIYFDDFRLIDDVGFEIENGRTKIQIGDVLLTIVGAIGRAAVVGVETEFTLQRSVAVIGDLSGIEPRYLSKAFLSPQLQRWLNENAKGTAQRGIYLKALGEIAVPLAPLPEQRRIVAKIDSLTAKSKRARDHLDHIPRLVEKYKQAILAAAFRGDLTRATSAAVELTVDRSGIDPRLSELEDVPTDWAWTSIGAVGFVKGGLTKNSARSAMTTTRPYLRVANVYANDLRLDEVSLIGCSEAEYSRTALQSGDLLIVEGNGSLDQVGRVAMWRGELPECTHQNHLIRLRLRSEILPSFALFWLLSPAGRTAIETVASSSSGLHTLSISKVEGLPIPVCSRALQEQIVRRIETAFAWIDRLATEATSARKLVDKLDQAVLAKAFRGELVPQDPSDEPASVLLDRIRAERAGAPKAKRGRKKLP